MADDRIEAGTTARTKGCALSNDTTQAVEAPLDVRVLIVRRHTPGPWRAKPYGVVVGGSAIALPRGSVQQQVAMVCVIDDGDRDANARLIAAAPDLLGALQELRYACTDKAEAMADAAIASAVG